MEAIKHACLADIQVQLVKGEKVFLLFANCISFYGCYFINYATNLCFRNAKNHVFCKMNSHISKNDTQITVPTLGNNKKLSFHICHPMKSSAQIKTDFIISVQASLADSFNSSVGHLSHQGVVNG